MSQKMIYSPALLDFDTGGCIEPMDAELVDVMRKISCTHNPFIGNKRTLIYDIISTLDHEQVEYSSVLDLFSGGGSMSLAWKMLGKQVFSNDLLKTCHVYAKAFVENCQYGITKQDLELVCQREPVQNNHFMEQHYPERFFVEEARQLDKIFSNVQEVYFSGSGEQYVGYLILANVQLYIIHYCYLGGRLSKRQIIAQKEHRMENVRNHGKQLNCLDSYLYDFAGKYNQCTALNMDAFDCLDFLLDSRDKKIDLAYIDPPYAGQQSNYPWMYQVLESWLRQEETAKWIDGPGMKKFIYRRTYKDNFVEMLKKLDFIPVWAFSYNDQSWASIEEIVKIIEPFRKHVSVYSFRHRYNYRKVEKHDGIEYLIVANSGQGQK